MDGRCCSADQWEDMYLGCRRLGLSLCRLLEEGAYPARKELRRQSPLLLLPYPAQPLPPEQTTTGSWYSLFKKSASVVSMDSENMAC